MLRKRKRSFTCSYPVVGCALIAVLWALPPLRAQTEAFSGALSGTVYDHTGAAIPGAKVTLSSSEKRITQTFTTSAAGMYGFSLLPPATYDLRVEKSGFRSYVQSGIAIVIGESARQDVTLEVGAVTQEVTVTASAGILNTANANVASDVSPREVQDLPLNLRSVFFLVRLDASVQDSEPNQVVNPPGEQGTADQDVGFFNFGGSRFFEAIYLVDGQWNSDGQWGSIQYSPFVDETQEMKVQTNAFTAQYGWGMGNVVNITTRSGSSEIHGDAYDFLRNSDLDSNNYFANLAGLPIASFKRNQFGAVVGGPLYIPKLYEHRDKTFFFLGYEGLRQQTPLTLVATIPTAAMRTGNFSPLLGPQVGTDALGRPVLSGQIYNPFTTRTVTAGQTDPVTGLQASQSGYIRDPIAGNVIPPGMIDPLASTLTQFWPTPTSPGLADNFTATGGAPNRADRYTVRMDENISDNSRMFYRWSQNWQCKQRVAEFFGVTDPGGPGLKSCNARFDNAFNFNHVFSPTFDMGVTYGYNRHDESQSAQSCPFNPSTLGLPASLDTNPGCFPIYVISGYVLPGTAGVSLGAGNINAALRMAETYAVDFTKIRGAHAMNFGFMGVRIYQNYVNTSQASFTIPLSMSQGPDPTAPNSTSGLGMASFMLGAGSSGSITAPVALPAVEKTYDGWYFQDDWKATRKLNLNLGVRYDFQTPITDRFNRQSWFNYTGANPISSEVGLNVPGYLTFTGAPNRRGLYNIQWTNVAPRLGLSYLLTNKLVMRAGFGMFYVPTQTFWNVSLDGFQQTTPYEGTVNGITPVNRISNPFPTGLLGPVGKSLGGLTNVGLSTNAVENYYPTPYVEQWMLDFQYELSPNDKIDVGYVGNHGVKLAFASLERDQLPPSQLSMRDSLLAPVTNPYYGLISTSSCGLNASTVPAGQLLRPYPEFCGVEDPQVNGSFAAYNALDITYTHRWSRGLQFMASFSGSKYLTNSEGPGGWLSGGSSAIRNYYNLSEEKSLASDDIPRALVLSYIYELPVGHGRHFLPSLSKPVDAVLGDWQVSGVTTFKSGFPLPILDDTNNTNSFGGGQRPDLIGNPHIAHPTVYEWFNTAAFAQPPPFTFGNVSRFMPNLRSPGINNWDLGIEKSWRWQEKLRLQFRAEIFNLINHPQFYAPDSSMGDPAFGEINGTTPARDIQFGLKLFW